MVQPVTASLKLSWTVTSPRWCRGTRGDRGTERQRRRRSSRVRSTGKGWDRGGQGGVRTGIESVEGSSDPLATGLGGYSGSDRGDSQRRSEWRPRAETEVPRSRRRWPCSRDRFLYKIFFFPFSSGPFPSFSPRESASAFRSSSWSLRLSLLVDGRALASVSFPPCRAYNVRPDRTWIRRRAGSFLTDIFGYPRRLESDLWSTSVQGPEAFWLARLARSVCVCVPRSAMLGYNSCY